MSLSSFLRALTDALYFTPHSRIISREMWRYLLCGVGNYIVLDSLLYALLYNVIVDQRWLDLGFFVISPHILSLLIVFPITLASGFWLNRNVAFRVEAQRSGKQFRRYLLSILGSIVLSYLLMKLFVEILFIWPTPAKILSSVITAVYGYLMARYFTFTTKNRGRKFNIKLQIRG